MDDGDQCLWEAIHKKIQIIKTLENKRSNRYGAGAGELQKYLGQSLRMVTKSNNLGLVKKLIEEENADPNDQDTEGCNSLMIAVKNGHVSILEYFLSLSDKVNINAKKKHGDTSLFLACLKGYEKVDVVRKVEVVRILMGSPQLDVNVAEKDGMTPLIVSCMQGHEAIVSMLLGHEDIQVNKANVNMMTPLMAACGEGQLGVVRLLLGRDDIKAHSSDV